jgi:hypothetical protein
MKTKAAPSHLELEQLSLEVIAEKTSLSLAEIHTLKSTLSSAKGKGSQV